MSKGIGWRLWHVVENSGELVPPYVCVNPDIPQVPWHSGWNVAACPETTERSGPEMFWTHKALEPAPARNCWCGFHVCPDPEPLRSLPHFDRLSRSGLLVVGQVEYGGRIQRANFFQGDPPGTLRVERARLLRLDLRHVPVDRHATVAQALRERYGVTVVDQRLAELHAALFGDER